MTAQADVCTKCGASLAGEEPQEHFGQILCEDCYLEVLSPIRTCDPWAVHTAKSLKDLPGGLTLTPRQQQLLDLVKEKGEVPSRKQPGSWGSVKMSCSGNSPCCATWNCSGPARRTKASS